MKKNGPKEKVDIAILKDNVPQIFVEVKSIDVALDGNEGQLARYFNSCNSVTLGILTNGIEWRFYTDTATDNVMDAKPFHVAKLDAAEVSYDVLLRFSKPQFTPASICEYATDLLFTAKIADFLKSEIDIKDQMPSDALVRWILKSPNIFEGIVNNNTIERFRGICKNALTRVIRGIVRRSVSAMEGEVSNTEETQPQQPQVQSQPIVQETETPEKEHNPNIITTENELKFFDNVKKIYEEAGYSTQTIYEPGKRQDIPMELGYKDTTAYFGVYLNKPGWWVMRGFIENRIPCIGFNVAPEVADSLISNKELILAPTAYANVRIAIKNVDDIFNMKDLVLAAIEETRRQRKSDTQS